MRKPVIAGNFKMYKTPGEVVEYAEGLKKASKAAGGVGNAEIVIAPAFPALVAAASVLEGSNIALAAQDVFWEAEGAYTGEVSAAMLVQAGCSHVIVGHSERRTIFGETDEMVSKKLHAALAHGIKPILCVGENLEQNQAGETEEFVGGQVRAAFTGLTAEQARLITVAYEPIWAIGTGLPATGEGANAIIGETVRGTLVALYGDDVAQAIRVQYGGSVKPANAADLMSMPDIDGGLVGGASLVADDFVEIVRLTAAGRQ